MKKAGRSLAAVLLLCILTTAAFAGQIDTPPVPTPGGGQIEVTTYVGETATIDTLAEFALDIWKSMPSLF